MTPFTGRIVTPSGVIGGTLELAGDRIASITPVAVSYDAPWIVPGFVDMHVHGGGGHTMTTGDPDEVRRAAEFHLSHGTTSLLASLVSSPYELMRDATIAYQPLIDEGVIEGIHFEGPYLSSAMCGAQNPAYLRDPSPDELRDLLDIGVGSIRMITIAPELPGALDAITLLVSRGITVAIGHTDATYPQVVDATAAGAQVGTHLFNGMRPPHHRAPGPVYALLATPSVACEIIADGIHLADDTLRFAASMLGASRATLVTDAISAAGMPDGRYELGGQAVTVVGGVARLAMPDGSLGAIAGSTLTMDRAFLRAAQVTGSIVDAAAMAATTPARMLGLNDRGVLSVGLRADFVLMDPALEVTAVVRGGVRVM